MQDSTTSVDDKTGWDELRSILKLLSPFAVLVWTATLFWSLFADPTLTALVPAVLTAITIATLFGPADSVAMVWSFVLRIVIAAIVIGAFCCLIYFGVQLTFAAIGWVFAFPFRHPFLFVSGLILVCLIAAGLDEDKATKNKKHFTSGFPPVPNDAPPAHGDGQVLYQDATGGKDSTFIYLMKNRRNGYYKIGRSKNPKYRERTLQSEEPDVSLVWKVKGTHDDEKHLHKKFKSVRLRGEWFSLSGDDVRWITSCSSRQDLYLDG